MRDLAASAAAPAAICKTVRRGSFKAFPQGGPAGADYHAVADTRNNSCRRASHASLCPFYGYVIRFTRVCGATWYGFMSASACVAATTGGENMDAGTET